MPCPIFGGGDSGKVAPVPASPTGSKDAVAPPAVVMESGGPATGKAAAPARPAPRSIPENKVPAITPETVIEYLTDVEGNWEYMVRFISMSEILFWEGPTQGHFGPGKLKIKPHGILVFGGDAPDKGPGDERIVRTLSNLKSEAPSQVFIILGNRDTIKLRFLAELSEGDDVEPWIPPWDRERAPTYENFIQKRGLTRGKVSKCHWLLNCTMGCQDTTFGTRQDELAMLYGPAKATDDDVVQSYIQSVDPESEDPWMLDFCRCGLLALVLGDTLFVHGGLQDDSAGHVPGLEAPVEEVREWADRLNAWKDEQLRAYMASPRWQKDEKTGERSRAASELIEYGTPGAKTKTVVYHNPFVDGNPVQRSQAVQDFLEKGGIKRLVTGHQPHGQMPTVVRHPKTGLLAITADTSRSDADGSKVLNAANNRGNVASVVSIQGDRVSVRGQAKTGLQHGFTLHVDPDKDVLPCALVGRQLADGSWVKSVAGSGAGARVIVARGRGFNVEVKHLTPAQACIELSDEYTRVGKLDVTLKSIVGNSKAVGWQQNDLGASDDGLEVCIEASEKFDWAAFEKYETFIFSFHGVIRSLSEEDQKKAVANINRLIDNEKRVVFVTNDATKSRVDFYKHMTQEFQVRLDETSCPISPASGPAETSDAIAEKRSKSHIITAAYNAAWFLNEAGLKKPFVLTSGVGLLQELEDVGITEYVSNSRLKRDEGGGSLEPDPAFHKEVSEANMVELASLATEVDCIVVGWADNISGLALAFAAQCCTWREERRAANPELTQLPIVTTTGDHSGILGRMPDSFEEEWLRGKRLTTYASGTVARAICNAVVSKQPFEPIAVGKPSPILLNHLMRPAEQHGLGIDLSKAVVIGDGLDTDVQFALSGGMKSLLVLSGVTETSNLKNHDKARWPTWTAESFASL